MDLPVGFRFYPTEEELVRHYLVNKLAGNPIPCNNVVLDCDVYGEKDPWEIWELFYNGDPASKDSKLDKYIYLFSTVKKVAKHASNVVGKKSNVVRKVGSSGGTWHGQNSGKSESEDGLVWFTRKFQYKNENRLSQDGCWVMQEYSLEGNDSVVICRIGKNEKRKTRDRDGDFDDEHHARSYNPTPHITASSSSVAVVADGYLPGCSPYYQTPQPAKHMKMTSDHVEETRVNGGFQENNKRDANYGTLVLEVDANGDMLEKDMQYYGISL